MADTKKNTEENEKIGNQIRTGSRLNLFQRLAARAGFVIASDNTDKEKSKKANKYSSFKVIRKPTDLQLTGKSTKEELDLISQLASNTNMSSTIQELFDEWSEDTQNTYANIKEREDRLNSFTMMCDNEGLVKTAVTLVASEVASMSDTNAFTVISEDKEWQNEINYLLKDVWKYDQQTIYSLAWDIFLYGEAFQGREVSSAGIIGIEGVKVNEIVERLEFKPSRVANFIEQMQAGGCGSSSGFTANITMPTNGGFGTNNLNFNFNTNQTTYETTDNLLKDYIENLSDICSAEYFTPHLLGYRIFGDRLVAPWQISHFRFNAEVSEFWPYGQPPLLACLSAFKQLQRVMGLDDLEKLLSMPVHVYKVNTKGLSMGRAFDTVRTVKERYENVGLQSTAAGLEGPSLCTNIWTSEDLVTHEISEAGHNNDSGSVDKMKFFRERLSTATGIPMTYMDPNSDGFQMSGVALQTLFRPFRTLVEQIRGIIQREVEDTIRLHDSILGRETPPFVMTMNVNNSVSTEDTSGKLQLVDTILEAIAGLLNVEKEKLPRGVKRDILIKYGGFNSTELKNYENILDNEGEETAEISDEELDADFGDTSVSDIGGASGGDEEDFGEADEGMEESYLRGTQRRLIEERYKISKKNNAEVLKYYLAESLGQFKTAEGTYKFNERANSRFVTEIIDFVKEHRNTKDGKMRLED